MKIKISLHIIAECKYSYFHNRVLIFKMYTLLNLKIPERRGNPPLGEQLCEKTTSLETKSWKEGWQPSGTIFQNDESGCLRRLCMSKRWALKTRREIKCSIINIRWGLKFVGVCSWIRACSCRPMSRIFCLMELSRNF